MPSRPTVRAAGAMPAELTRTRSGAELAGHLDGGLDLLGVGDVDLGERPADVGCESPTLVGLDVGDDDLGALGCKLASDRGTDAGGRTGDERTGSCDVHAGEHRTRRTSPSGGASADEAVDRRFEDVVVGRDVVVAATKVRV